MKAPIEVYYEIRLQEAIYGYKNDPLVHKSDYILFDRLQGDNALLEATEKVDCIAVAMRDVVVLTRHPLFVVLVEVKHGSRLHNTVLHIERID